MDKNDLIESIRLLCELEKARAEAIVLAATNSNFKAHEPTIENHRGQLLVLQKLASLLDNGRSVRYNRGDLLEWYVAARSDGWKCEPALPNSDNWEHAILSKNGYTAEINIPGGTLVVWRDDRTVVERPIPYEPQNPDS